MATPNPRTEVFCVRLTKAEMAAMDAHRGGASRARWLRRLINEKTGRANAL